MTIKGLFFFAELAGPVYISAISWSEKGISRFTPTYRTNVYQFGQFKRKRTDL